MCKIVKFHKFTVISAEEAAAAALEIKEKLSLAILADNNPPINSLAIKVVKSRIIPDSRTETQTHQ